MLKGSKMSAQLMLIALPPLTSSAAASPAKTSPSPAKALALKVSDPAFGSSTRESFASYDPASSLWKTSQRSLLADWAPFSETWPRSGTMRSGIASRLPPLVPLTSETDCSFVAYSNGARLEGRRQSEPEGPHQRAAREGRAARPNHDGGGRTQSGLGRAVARLPARVDRWPAGQGEAQYGWEAPRVCAVGGTRAARIKALGNTVVPQVAEIAGHIVMRIARNLEAA